MSSKQAVYLTLGIYPGGQTRTATEVRAQQNLAALKALDYEITTVTMPDSHDRLLAGKVVLVDPPPVHHFVGLNIRWRYRRKMQKLIAELVVDPQSVIFCEHWAALLCAPRHPRVVYSFHDFESNLIKVRRLRKSYPVTWKTRAYWRLAAWMERRLLRRAARIICVSASETDKLRANWQANAEYIPTVPFTEPPALKEFKAGPLRLWFYGSSGATSNKIMLDHLMGELFTPLSSALPSAEFHQLGAYSTYDAEKIKWLHDHFTVHGFVEDPAKMFQTGDICLMPYQQDTGFRTKIPEVCGYGMIPAGYGPTFACCPEMRDGFNCIIAETPAQLVEKLAQLQADEPARRRLATNAYQTRRQDFSFAVLLERYRHILKF
jgi:glycosyltransferase involved in cell wall biosynthesis